MLSFHLYVLRKVGGAYLGCEASGSFSSLLFTLLPFISLIVWQDIYLLFKKQSHSLSNKY